MAERSVMLDADEIDMLLTVLKEAGHGRDGGDYEPECPACTAADKLAELQREAARYRWLTKNAYVGVCFTDQVESGQILEIGGCDRRVPDEVGEFCDVGKAIDAAMATDAAVKGT